MLPIRFDEKFLAHELCHLLLCGREAEDVGTQQFEELTPRWWNTGLMPFTYGGRLDLAQPRHLSSSAEGPDDFGIGMDIGHGASLGIPTACVNRHSYSSSK